MSNNVYELMLEQERKQQEIQKEADLELKFLFVLELTDKEICISEIGKDNSRSITAQIRKWKETLDENEINSKFTFVNLQNSFKRFREYLVNKYSGKKADQWRAKFEDLDFIQDVKRLLISRIYRHKYELTKQGRRGFFSGQAHNQVQLLEAKKDVRSFSHEASNKVVKYIGNKPEAARYLTRGDFEEIRRVVENVLDQRIKEMLPDQTHDSRLASLEMLKASNQAAVMNNVN